MESFFHLNTNGKDQNTYDAIVIGSGISGGWAAKELCDSGLKTLVLERGRMVEHIQDYPTANLNAWEMEHRGWIPKNQKEEKIVFKVLKTLEITVRSINSERK